MCKVARPRIAPLASGIICSSGDRCAAGRRVRPSRCEIAPAEESGGIMFDHLRTDHLDRCSKADYQAKRWKRRFPMYGHRFALSGVAILVVVGLFAIA